MRQQHSCMSIIRGCQANLESYRSWTHSRRTSRRIILAASETRPTEAGPSASCGILVQPLGLKASTSICPARYHKSRRKQLRLLHLRPLDSWEMTGNDERATSEETAESR